MEQRLTSNRSKTGRYRSAFAAALGLSIAASSVSAAPLARTGRSNSARTSASTTNVYARTGVLSLMEDGEVLLKRQISLESRRLIAARLKVDLDKVPLFHAAAPIKATAQLRRELAESALSFRLVVLRCELSGHAEICFKMLPSKERLSPEYKRELFAKRSRQRFARR